MPGMILSTQADWAAHKEDTDPPGEQSGVKDTFQEAREGEGRVTKVSCPSKSDKVPAKQEAESGETQTDTDECAQVKPLKLTHIKSEVEIPLDEADTVVMEAAEEAVLEVDTRVMEGEKKGTKWMWIHAFANEAVIEVKEWGSKPNHTRSFQKKDENGTMNTYELLWAKVEPKDRSSDYCPKCHSTCDQHHEDCEYKKQTAYGWCNQFPCRHQKKKGRQRCSRRHFGCNYCHQESTGHCIANHSDVVYYHLNLCDPECHGQLLQ